MLMLIYSTFVTFVCILLIFKSRKKIKNYLDANLNKRINILSLRLHQFVNLGLVFQILTVNLNLLLILVVGTLASSQSYEVIYDENGTIDKIKYIWSFI